MKAFKSGVGAALWALVLLVAGCGPSSVPDNPASGRHKTMVLHLMDDPAGFNPVNTVGATTVALQNLLFDHLIGLDPQSLELVPRLAEALPQVSPDGKTFTFTLRPGLQFVDREPLTTRDVVFSFKALMNPYVSSAPRRAELHNFSDCVALDERRVELRLSSVGPFNLNRLAINFFVIPQHIYDPEHITDRYSVFDACRMERQPDSVPEAAKQAMASFADAFEEDKFQREKGFVIGSGRYIFDGWKSGQYVRFVKNENYWAKGSGNHMDQQGMDTLLYKVIPDVHTALQALKSGEIDFSDAFEPGQYKNEMSGAAFDKHFGKESVAYPFYEYIGWNQSIKNEPQRVMFADRRVRMAMGHIIDVRDIVDNLLFGTAEPISSLVYAQRPEHNDDLKPLVHDMKMAQQLLADAGWSDTDGDGTLDKAVQGQQVPFSFSLCYKRGNELRKSIARQVQDQCAQVGIEVEVQEIDGSVLLDRLKRHEVDAWVGGWAFDSDEQDFYSLFHSSQIANEGYNWGSYHNPEADSLMEQIAIEWDEGARRTLHLRVQQLLYDDQPYTLLFANSARMGWNKRLATDGWYGQRPCYDPGRFHPATQ